MIDLERLRKVFSDSLGVSPDTVTDSLSYGSGVWDSIAHMALVAALEAEFEIMMETEDVIGMSSFAKAREIMGKHGFATVS